MRGLRPRSPSTTTATRGACRLAAALTPSSSTDLCPQTPIVGSNGRRLPGGVSTTNGAGRARIAMACGGSAGHVFPACAVADAQPEGVEAVFLGGVRGLEMRILRARGHRLLTTPAAPLAL